MFIQLNEKNEIIASASFKVDDTFIETNKNIVRGFDGKLYFEEEKPEKSLEELKKEKIQELKNNCQKYIYSKYPIYKQLNAANGLATEEEINLMNSFINETRLLCKEIEQKINSVKTQKELEKISTNFNQE